MKRICDCKIFNDYEMKEYKIKTVHKVFGKKEMSANINGFIETTDKVGIVAHGKELYCWKNKNMDSLIETNNMVIISDRMMEIFISI